MPSSAMVDLPVDIISDILSCLPVTSLLQFRSISKSWRSLIDSHDFKTLHLNKFHKLNSNLILGDNSELYAINLPTLGNFVILNQPLESYENRITILGSCNGLLCIKNIVDNIAIWNPSLRKHWILPCLPTSLWDECNISFGFGFDSFTGDYKLVNISYFYSDECTFKSKVNIFSCRTNEWKTLPNMPYARIRWYETIGVFIDHALHWIVKDNYRKLIVAFDLRYEVFNEVPLPDLGKSFQIEVSHLGACLSMFVNHQFTKIDFWVMKQYGYKDSWFKMFSLMESLELRSLEFVKSLGYYNGMQVLFKKDFNKLFWYDPKSKQVSHVTNPEIPYFHGAVIWVESLVQPLFPNQSNRKQQPVLECRNNTSNRKFCSLKF